jgi:hypothetical protein
VLHGSAEEPPNSAGHVVMIHVPVFPRPVLVGLGIIATADRAPVALEFEHLVVVAQGHSPDLQT